MSSAALNQLLSALKVKANVFHNGQYCGAWAVDTSGSNLMNFHIVTKGQCEIEVDDDVFTLVAGDAIFMPSDAKHLISSSLEGYASIDSANVNQAVSLLMTEDVEEQSTGLVCGHFTHQHPIFDSLLSQLPKAIVIKHNKDFFASQIISLILLESKTSEQNTNFLLNRLSDSLLYVLIRDNIATNHSVLAAMSHPKLSKSLEYIHDNIDQLLNVDAIAAYSGMSRSSFSALFKEVIALSPAEYIAQWRMTQAYRWLADEGISTYDAATRCGYESEASFSKAFKRIVGVGPGEARQINKNT